MRFRLKDFDPAYKGEYKSEEHAQAKLKANKERLARYQDLLFSDHSYALLIVLQAMDAAGKDGTIKHVMSGVNPAGCEVVSFKPPSAEELGHDFLWRTSRNCPIAAASASLTAPITKKRWLFASIPNSLLKSICRTSKPHQKFWQHRFDSINDIERHLVRNGTVILKFFLNVSKREQARRLLERLDDPKKNWKFSEADLRERLLWKDYMQAYEDMIDHTSTKHAPWYIIPADHKWFTHLTVSDIIVETLKGLKLKYPSVTAEQAAGLAKARAALQKEEVARETGRRSSCSGPLCNLAADRQHWTGGLAHNLISMRPHHGVEQSNPRTNAHHHQVSLDCAGGVEHFFHHLSHLDAEAARQSRGFMTDQAFELVSDFLRHVFVVRLPFGWPTLNDMKHRQRSVMLPGQCDRVVCCALREGSEIHGHKYAPGRAGLGPPVHVRPQSQHRYWRVPKDALGDRAHQHLAQATATVGTQHNQVALVLTGKVEDRLRHVAFQQEQLIVFALDIGKFLP